MVPLPRSEVQQDIAVATKRTAVSGKWLVPLVVGILAVVAVVAWLLVNAGGTTASISPGDVVFSPVQVGERSDAQTIRIKAGTRALRITNIGLDDVTAFQLVDSPCTGTRLEPGASCDESIVFAPTREGTAKAALLVSTEGSDAPLRVTLQGAAAATALASPSLSVSTPSLAPPVTPSPTPSAGPPNLVIGVLDVGRPVHETDGWHVPVSVVIANGGDSDAPLFEVALLRDVRGTDVIPFMVEGQATSVPATKAPLKPGAQTTITGFALLPSGSQGKIRIDVEADSCAIADPAHRKPCRVVESREDDNSLRNSVTLPAGPDLVVLRIDRAQASLPDPDGGVRHGSFVGVVANIGTVEAGASGLEVTVSGGDAKMESRVIQEIRGLAAGQQRTIKGTFDFFYSQDSGGNAAARTDHRPMRQRSSVPRHRAERGQQHDPSTDRLSNEPGGMTMDDEPKISVRIDGNVSGSQLVAGSGNTQIGSSVAGPAVEPAKPARLIRILFLAANPVDTPALRLDEEIRAIDGALREAEFRDRFEIRQEWATRIGDLQEALLRHDPDIVHFSGHGTEASEIVLTSATGTGEPVPREALGRLFAVLADHIRCVVLNACYSEGQAEAIAEHIDCVVGMTQAVGDDAAIEFATGFYRALAYGRSVQTAFDLGANLIALHGLPDEATPHLVASKGNAAEVTFVTGG